MRRNGGGTNWGKYRSPSIASPKLRMSARRVGEGGALRVAPRGARASDPPQSGIRLAVPPDATRWSGPIKASHRISLRLVRYSSKHLH
jgi:hypothetical protein